MEKSESCPYPEVKNSYTNFKIMIHKILPIFFTINLFAALNVSGGGVTIADSRHYSNVFGEPRNFRIFLPAGYFENQEKRYPVIYFLHGWSQRYFGPVGEEYANMDKGTDNNGDNIEKFVSGHDVIVVKADGYNRSAGENIYVRPYNVTPVETFRQFPVYFPELVAHIDAVYRTIPVREKRAVSGLSMGGFMTFWIGGKYPHLLSAAGSFCGSPEFTVGPKNFPSEYRHADMYKNYEGMNLRLNYGTRDFIRYYHRDLNRIWLQVMDNYEYKTYDAAHSTCGLGEMFRFLLGSFDNPPAKPARWNHIDVYPDFSVWDYNVSSDRIIPGFTILENVDRRGFRSAVREFMPDGELMPFVKVIVTTPPVYEKNQIYTINDINPNLSKASRKNIRSDQNGSLQIVIDGGIHEIGINKSSDSPEISIASFEIVNDGWATHGKDNAISIKLLNKGMSEAKGIIVSLSATRKSAVILKNESTAGRIGTNEIKGCHDSFVFRSVNDTAEIERFRLTIKDSDNNEWIDFIEVPVRKNIPEMTNSEICDGRTFTVSRAGTKEETVFLGKGNGDGIANPGESIVLLVRDQSKLWRTELFTSDKYVNPYGTNTRISDSWSELDHVGASAKYSIPLISSGCPANHEILFSAEYWLPEYPNHIIRQGVIRIKVAGQDKTPPSVQWIRIPGDNIIQVKVMDGSPVAQVKAKLVSEKNAPEFADLRIKDPEKTIEAELTDDGKGGDVMEGDNVFSFRIPEQKFFIYNVTIEATDSFGNAMKEQYPENFILH